MFEQRMNGRDLLARMLVTTAALKAALDAYDEALHRLPAPLREGALQLRTDEELLEETEGFPPATIERLRQANSMELVLLSETVKVALEEHEGRVWERLQKIERELLADLRRSATPAP